MPHLVAAGGRVGVDPTISGAEEVAGTGAGGRRRRPALTDGHRLAGQPLDGLPQQLLVVVLRGGSKREGTGGTVCNRAACRRNQQQPAARPPMHLRLARIVELGCVLFEAASKRGGG